MRNIKTFESFNNFRKKISNFFSNNDFRTEYSEELNQYNLKLKSDIDRTSIEILHNEILVGKVELSNKSKNYPIWKLTVYYYENEIKSDGSYRTPDEIPGQKEQPYAKSEKEFASDSDQAIRAFWKWWSTNTKSGRSRNPKFKVKS